MKTLANPQDCQEILNRIASLRPDNPRQFGKMTCSQMICHLADSLRPRFGEKAVSNIDTFFTRTALKRLALDLPMRWRPGFPTRPELDQAVGGTKPTSFEADRQELLTLTKRFVAAGPEIPWRHPVFGPMSERDLLRWAYRHSDHHLRQFGA
jgi:hypothetical protein